MTGSVHPQHDALVVPSNPECIHSINITRRESAQKFCCFPETTVPMITHKTDPEQLCNQPLYWKGSSAGHSLSCCTWLQGSQASCSVKPPWLHQIYRQLFALLIALFYLLCVDSLGSCCIKHWLVKELKLFNGAGQWPRQLGWLCPAPKLDSWVFFYCDQAMKVMFLVGAWRPALIPLVILTDATR